MSVKTFWESCVSLMYPDRCLMCGNVLGHSKSQFCLCPDCAKKNIFLDEVSTCRICGLPLKEEGARLCLTCQTHVHDFDRAVSCFAYKGRSRQAVLRYKFSDRRELCRPFAALMLARLQPFIHNMQFDAVLCAPLSANRFRQRGYNQSGLLAERIAKALDLPFWKDAFEKPVETPKQSSLHYADRLRNVRRAFRLSVPRKAIEGKRFILIDDIITTGATADALSGLLKHAGAAYVLVATIAVTEHKPQEGETEAASDEAASIIF